MEQYVEKIEQVDGTFMVAIQDGDKTLWGKVDKEGNEIVPCKYEEISHFVIEDWLIVKTDSLYGFC